jgi:hypothetical protein
MDATLAVDRNAACLKLAQDARSTGRVALGDALVSPLRATSLSDALRCPPARAILELRLDESATSAFVPALPAQATELRLDAVTVALWTAEVADHGAARLRVAVGYRSAIRVAPRNATAGPRHAQPQLRAQGAVSAVLVQFGDASAVPCTTASFQRAQESSATVFVDLRRAPSCDEAALARL